MINWIKKLIVRDNKFTDRMKLAKEQLFKQINELKEKMEAIESQTKMQPLSFEFTGKGFEYFKIWIVNICLSVVTLGIYSAWAKVHTKSYFYGNTVLGNSSFSYLADPKSILKGRIIAIILFVIYSVTWQYYPKAGIVLLWLGILIIPYFIVSVMSFRMRNSAYRNIRFHFFKDFKASYIVFLLPLGLIFLFQLFSYILVELVNEFALSQVVAYSKNDRSFLLSFILSALLIMPWLDYFRTRFLVTHTQYGKTKASFNIGGLVFYKVYFVTALICLTGIIRVRNN